MIPARHDLPAPRSYFLTRDGRRSSGGLLPYIAGHNGDPYDIFLNLEAAGSQELFRSDANSERYGLTPDPADPRWNPDGLPIGLGKTVTTEGPWKGEDIGMTCASCHNTELFYQGERVRIDGGVGNHFDLEAYVFALDDAVQGTLKDSAKFDRLAARMGASNADAKSDLRKRSKLMPIISIVPDHRSGHPLPSGTLENGRMV